MRNLKIFVLTTILIFTACSSKLLSKDIVYTKSIKSIKTTHHITIDAGHGGRDPGAISWNNRYKEKTLTMKTALMLRKHLKKMGYTTSLTRSKNVFVPLKRRADIANKRKSELFVSIHFNAAHNKNAQGVEIYYYPTSNHSKHLATITLQNILNQIQAPSRGIKGGYFSVLTETKMPAILIEGGFMSSPQEMNKLKDSKYLNRIAQGIANGIDQYIKTYANK